MIRTLFVDDQPAILELCEAFLSRDGEFNISTCTSAEEALGLLEEEDFDAVVSDYEMPSIDGIEFLKKVRSAGKQVPFILFTGKGREDVVIEALNNGADFYIKKGGESRSQFAELSNLIRQSVSKREAELAVEYNARRFGNIMRNTSDMVLILDSDMVVRYITPSVKDILGYPAESLIGDSLASISIEEYLPGMSSIVKRALELPQEIIRFEITMTDRDGVDHILECLVRSLIQEGQDDQIIANVRDITERKMFVEELDMRSQELEFLLDHTDAHVWYMMDSKTYGTVNKAHADFFCLTKDEMKGSDLWFSHSPEEAEKCYAGNVEVFGTKRTAEMTEWFLTKDGRRRLLHVRKCPVINEVGDVDFLICTGEDITERHLMEQELRNVTRRSNLVNAISRKGALLALREMRGMMDRPDMDEAAVEELRHAMDKGLMQVISFRERLDELQRGPSWTNLDEVIRGCTDQSLQDISFDLELKNDNILVDPLFSLGLSMLVEKRYGQGARAFSFRVERGDGKYFLTMEDDGESIEDKRTLFNETDEGCSCNRFFMVREAIEINGMTIVENGYGLGARFKIGIPSECFNRIQ